ncbi:hypothetical protein [Phenylobacterium sp.]|uniref:hypothetical protein n=1 Tax=Phenylobacterium sp. TaxID=1871053 RepID=UPI002B740B2F|nr:hypothetical protein [Phenylobacterium sp.]HLZ73848.1 hypothetical protein [Phenylobacterium sp.]
MRAAIAALFAATVFAGPALAAPDRADDWLCRVTPTADLLTNEFVLRGDRKTLCVGGECRVMTAPDDHHRQYRCGELEADHHCLRDPLLVPARAPLISAEHIVFDLAARSFEGEAAGQIGMARGPYDRSFMGSCSPVPGGSAAAVAEHGPPALTRLSEGEVRALFSTQIIIREGAFGGGLADQFTPDGGYSQSGKFVPRQGTYDIRGDLVCVSEEGGAETCRTFYRAPDGQLWQTINFGGTGIVVAIGRVRIEYPRGR